MILDAARETHDRLIAIEWLHASVELEHPGGNIEWR